MKTEGKRNLLRQPDEIRLMTGGAQTEQETAPDAAAFRAGDVTVELAEADGSLVVDTSTLAPGEYIFSLAGQPGKENPGAICSTPGGIRLTIHEKPVVKGDINGDGVIDSTDVMALFNAINSGDDLDATVADVNGDGVIDARDVMALYNIIKSDN